MMIFFAQDHQLLPREEGSFVSAVHFIFEKKRNIISQTKQKTLHRKHLLLFLKKIQLLQIGWYLLSSEGKALTELYKQNKFEGIFQEQAIQYYCALIVISKIR